MSDSQPEPTATNEATKLLTPDEVKKIETRQLLKRRRVAFLSDDKTQEPDAEAAADADLGDCELNDTVGLAISGGGLRSATFNDGMLTAFSHRGLLRYVDYISAVSGGAYITGNLLCRGKEFSEVAKEDRSFHDADLTIEGEEDENPTIVQVSDLGFDRETGKPIDEKLKGAGNYLMQKTSLICVHAIEFLCRALVYVGLTGIVATLVALLFRSCDTLQFRHLYFNYLAMGTWGELGIAFLPTAWVILFCLFGTFIFQATRFDRWLSNKLGMTLSMLRRNLSTFALGLIAFFTVASLAIFFGNGYTGISNSENSLFELENWALTLGTVAAIFQIMVFFGRDRLMKSERQTASNFQKTVHAVLLTSMTGFVVFFAIYLVGRENISNYVGNRGQDLVTGDVWNWRQLKVIHDEYKNQSPNDGFAKLSLLNDQETEKLYVKSEWADYCLKHDSTEELISGLVGWGESNDSKLEKDSNGVSELEEVPMAYYPVGIRFLATMPVWLYSLNPPDVSSTSPPGINTKQDFGTLGGSLERWAVIEAAKRSFLENFNEHTLSSAEFQKFLVEKITGEKPIQHSADSQVPRSHEFHKLVSNLTSALQFKVFSAIPKPPEAKSPNLITAANDRTKAIGAIEARMPKWPHSKCQDFVENCLSVLKNGNINVNSYGDLAAERATKRFNRECLDVMSPGMLAPHGVVSTHIVPEKDQRARLHLLYWACFLTLLGLAISAFYPTGALYRFYRESIANQFLTSNVFGARREHQNSPELRYSELPISDFDLTDVGLPIPIINCAELMIDDKSKEIEAVPFNFTPHYVGSEHHGMISPSKYQAGTHISKSNDETNVPVADAICISGAALSTQMSRSLGTRTIMDLFGVELGRYLSIPRKQAQSNAKNWLGYTSKFAKILMRHIGRSEKSSYRHIADGGFTDYLGVMELLERRCRLIVVSDAGINTSDDELQHLARMLEQAKKNMGIQFYDLDHDSPLNFLRLDRNIVKESNAEDAREDTVAPQQFVCMRVRYPDRQDEDAYLIYAQMVICEDDPLEIKQIRQKFPDFPDEPTTNQFFTQQQVDAYHRLGYYIGSLICSEAEPWSANKIVYSINAECAHKKRWHLRADRATPGEVDRFSETREIIEGERKSQPLFDAMLERLLLGYRMACYREKSHSTDDVFSEAIWQDDQAHFPHFSKGIDEIKAHFHKLKKQRPDLKNGNIDQAFTKKLIDYWMVVWERNADIRNAYRDAVFQDINLLKRSDFSEVAQMQEYLWTALAGLDTGDDWDSRQLATTLHLAAMAMACQQFHTAWLGKIFQIGGRKKLVALIAHMGQQVCQEEHPNSTPEEQIEVKLQNLCPGLLEMQTCVFRQGGQNVVVSFSVCLSIALNLVKQPNIDSLRIDWCSLSDFIAKFGRALNSQSRSKMVDGLSLLSNSVRPQFKSTAEFMAPEMDRDNKPDDEDPTEIGQLLT